MALCWKRFYATFLRKWSLPVGFFPHHEGTAGNMRTAWCFDPIFTLWLILLESQELGKEQREQPEIRNVDKALKPRFSATSSRALVEHSF